MGGTEGENVGKKGPHAALEPTQQCSGGVKPYAASCYVFGRRVSHLSASEIANSTCWTRHVVGSRLIGGWGPGAGGTGRGGRSLPLIAAAPSSLSR